VQTQPIQPVHPTGSKPPIWRRWWAVIVYAIVLVLIGAGIGSSGKTTTNTAASKPAPAVTDTVFKTIPAPTVKVTITRSAPTRTVTVTASPSPPQPAQPASSPSSAVAAGGAAGGSCHPLSNEGTCYEPGEFCRKSDHGVTGVAGDGKTIICEDNDGWRWEPA
jgi:hypothetical protein